MLRLAAFLILGAITLLVLQWLHGKWRRIDLEEKENEIKETEREHGKVKELKKKHPDFERKKKEVSQFKKNK